MPIAIQLRQQARQCYAWLPLQQIPLGKETLRYPLPGPMAWATQMPQKVALGYWVCRGGVDG